ncbi:MAG: methyltransferase domain-containing protein [Burkholderiaceae bacterium]|nr:methyltransferase domain-containing protein [Burkholderiaceae bacterium]
MNEAPIASAMSEASSALATERHLDLGCGARPRNPYGRRHLYGVDLNRPQTDVAFEFASANLALQPIPFASDLFGSVSAFDFIEHVPRVLNGAEPNTTCFPFVRLMDEVWRVLAPGGLFYALTPCYPSAPAFMDPTHVNIITDRTHEYFCGEQPIARMYGFEGRFTVRLARWVIPEHSYTNAPLTWRQSLARWNRERRGRMVYFLWELEAVKPARGAEPNAR